MNSIKCQLRMFLLLLVSLVFSPASTSQEPPKDLSQWDLICWCDTTNGTPHHVIRADTNGQILYLAQHGATREQLKAAGVSFNDSQIDLLKDWRMLRQDGDKLQTNMPVLGPEELQKLRAFLKERAVNLAPSLEPDLRTLVATLNQQGHSKNDFSVVFSYLLDGIVWNRFDEQHLLPQMQVTVEKPFWNGAFWALYPKRTGAPGTNTYALDNWVLGVTWTKPVLPALGPLGDSAVSDPFMKEMEKQGQVTDAATRTNFGALGIVDAEGKPTIPVIHENSSDPVYQVSLKISHHVSDAMLGLAKSPELAALTQSTDQGQALLIGYHEFMWELLGQIERDGIVQEPALLLSDKPIAPAEVGGLAYIVERATK